MLYVLCFLIGSPAFKKLVYLLCFLFFPLLLSTVGASLPVANWLSFTPQKMCMKLELFGKKSLAAPRVMCTVLNFLINDN